MIVAALALLVAASLAIGIAFGAPYVPILSDQIEPLLDALGLKSGQTLLDLGCGDGRVLKAAAKRGVKGVGYEINPWVWLVAKINCWRYRGLVKIRLVNFWKTDLPKTDAIFTFLITGYMPKLNRLLQDQIKTPTKVLSYVYEIPEVKPKQSGRNYFLYIYPLTLEREKGRVVS